MSRAAWLLLVAYAWPGNVRQLQNVIHNVLVLHEGVVLPEKILPSLHAAPSAAVNHAIAATPAAGPPVPQDIVGIMKLDDVEGQSVEQAIMLCHGNTQMAARKIGISPSTIYRKREAWHIVSGNEI